MSIHHKRGCEGVPTAKMLPDTNLEGRPNSKTCPPSPNPSSSLKVKAKNPTMPYMVIVTTMVNKCKLSKCDDQQAHLLMQMSYSNKSQIYHLTTKIIIAQVYNGVLHLNT